jgi:hypothetical protein
VNFENRAKCVGAECRRDKNADNSKYRVIRGIKLGSTRHSTEDRSVRSVL